jgi:hypothetical protein
MEPITSITTLNYIALTLSAEASQIFLKRLIFYQNHLTMINNTDVTGDKPIVF